MYRRCVVILPNLLWLTNTYDGISVSDKMHLRWPVYVSVPYGDFNLFTALQNPAIWFLSPLIQPTRAINSVHYRYICDFTPPLL